MARQRTAIRILRIMIPLALLGAVAHAEASETTLDLNGSWRLERTENFEQYLKDPAGARLARFLAAFAGGLPVVGGGEAVAPRFGSVDRIPTVFVFDRTGRSVMHFIHQQGAAKTHATYEELAAAVQAAL